MATDLATRENGAEIMEAVIAAGDLAKLPPEKRVAYYTKVCSSLGLNPFVQPFQYITLNGKLTLYATRTAADQLRRLNGVSISKPDVQFDEGLCVVSVTATTSDGRTDSELGVVTIEGLKGETRANAIMKAITKAKRRVTLSIVGLGWLDETEVETIRDARTVQVDHETGEIVQQEPAEDQESPAQVVERVQAFCQEATTGPMLDAARDFANSRRGRLNTDQRAAVKVAIGLAAARLLEQQVEADGI